MYKGPEAGMTLAGSRSRKEAGGLEWSEQEGVGYRRWAEVRPCRPHGPQSGGSILFSRQWEGEGNDTIQAGVGADLRKTQITSCHPPATPWPNSHHQYHLHDLDPSPPPFFSFSLPHAGLQPQPSPIYQPVTPWYLCMGCSLS